VYRPIALFPLFAASFLLLFERFRFHRGDIFLIAFVFYSASNSLIQAAISNDLGSSLKHIVTLLIGVSIYRAATYSTGLMREESNGTRMLVGALLIAFIPGLIVGFMQMVDGFVFHNGFSRAITGILAEKVYRSRIQMFSGEPSWAAIHLLTGCLLVYFLYKERKMKLGLLTAMVTILILTFSAYAYSVILIALFVFILINSKKRLQMLLTTAIILGFVLGLVPYLIQTFGITGYYVQRFNLDKLNWDYLINNDNSFFVRVVFPMIGFLEFLRHPITGMGGGFYYKEFTDLLLSHFSSGLNFKEVYDIAMLKPESATSRNMFSKLFSEEGLVGVILFFGFLVTIVRSSCKNPYSKFVFALAVSMVMNFDSYAFVDFWILLGFLRGGFFETSASLPLLEQGADRILVRSASKAQYS
jgi:hypothetical protein